LRTPISRVRSSDGDDHDVHQAQPPTSGRRWNERHEGDKAAVMSQSFVSESGRRFRSRHRLHFDLAADDAQFANLLSTKLVLVVVVFDADHMSDPRMKIVK